METAQIAAGQIWRDELNRYYRVVADCGAYIFVKPAHLKHVASTQVLRAWFETTPEHGGWTFVR